LRCSRRIQHYTAIGRQTKQRSKKRKPAAYVNGEVKPVRHRSAEKDGKAQRDRVRAYANEHGVPCAPTGIIPRAAYAAYYAEHPDEKVSR
jgi:hypothetical protein